jgi:poly(3-hydroxybutyrate) depolymerase
VQKNGCGTGIDDTGGPILGPHLTKPAPNNAICEFSQGCPADGQVVFCKFQGMAHAWAGGPANYQGGFFNNSAYDSATDLAWTFFKNYAW